MQNDNAKLQERIVEIGGIKTFIRTKGQGKPFLILHGWGGSSDSWKEVQTKLANRFWVIVPDLPGFGKSDAPKKAWNVECYVEFVFALLNKLNIVNEFYLLGHSFGGAIATKIAVTHPEKIKKLILVNAKVIRSHRNPIKMMAASITKLINLLFGWVPGYKYLRRLFYRFFLRKTDYLEAKGIMRETFKRVISENLKYLCPKVASPTLIIWGKRDKITPLREGLKLHRLIPNSEIVIIDEAKHAPNLSHPQKLAQIINQKIV
ncbi:alpha/beta hydrolase [bacterium]|nr:alpha/beta hydrolase [bacterium]